MILAARNRRQLNVSWQHGIDGKRRFSLVNRQKREFIYKEVSMIVPVTPTKSNVYQCCLYEHGKPFSKLYKNPSELKLNAYNRYKNSYGFTDADAKCCGNNHYFSIRYIFRDTEDMWLRIITPTCSHKIKVKEVDE